MAVLQQVLSRVYYNLHYDIIEYADLTVDCH